MMTLDIRPIEALRRARCARLSQTHRGVTLVELLIVISIIVLLLAISVPRLRPLMETRRIREAARAANAYIGAARNRAMETGRPVGVVIERLEQQPEAAVILRMAEVPPPYAGDTLNARAQARVLTASAPPVLQLRFPLADVATLQTGVLGEPHSIRLNYQGPDFPILRIVQTDQFVFAEANIPPTVDRLPYPQVSDPTDPWTKPDMASLPVPFQIQRRPETTAAAPLRLPGRTVIDLSASGTDSMLTQNPPPFDFFNPIDKDADNTNGVQDPSTVTILFGPNGSVDRLYYQDRVTRVTEPIYLLVGRWDRMPATPGGPPLSDDGLYNYQDIQNIWLVINANSGLIMAAPLAGSGGAPPANVAEAREDARHFEGLGGR